MFELLTPQNIPSGSKPDQTSIFIFTDVLGNSSTMEPLVEALSKMYPNRPIYAFNDPYLSNSSSPLNTLSSLELKIEVIAKSMQALFINDEYHSCPFIIVGYSFGCTLAALVAKYLKEQQEEALVYLIDGPSPSYSKVFFTENKHAIDSTLTLIDVINYASKLSNFSERVNVSHKELNFLVKKSIKDRIDTIIENLIKKEKCENSCREKIFLKYIHVMKNNIMNLITYQPDNNKTDLIIKTLLTKKTIADFNISPITDPYCGWNTYSTLIENDSSLADVQHVNLINKNNAEQIAQSINQFIKKYITQISLQRELKHVSELCSAFKFNDLSNKLISISNELNTPSLTDFKVTEQVVKNRKKDKSSIKGQTKLSYSERLRLFQSQEIKNPQTKGEKTYESKVLVQLH